MHKLLIEDDEGKTVAVPLTRAEITIGRKEGNTIRLTEQNVSRSHAKFTLRENHLQIEDLGSHNGTKLNGIALTEPAQLKDGDLILIGDYRLGIQEDLQTVSVSTPGVGAPVTEMMEGQPTIPVSTMLAHLVGTDPPGRLVVTGQVLGGKEFVLDRPSLVIGRTPENDVILDHKSISRHHAKIIREGNRYVIVDLESANGVRVRGIERDRTELRPGDLVELGEVRLRFVLGEEPYVDESASFLSGKRNVILLGAGGILAVALVIFFVSSDSTKAPVAEAPPPLPPPPALTQPPPIPPPPPPPVSIDSLLATARAAMEAENWEKALSVVSIATTQEPGSTEAAMLRKSIELEKEASEKIALYKAAIEGKNFEVVLDGAKTFPAESRRKPAMDELLKLATPGFIELHLEKATALAAEKQCEEARREAELVFTVAPNNIKARRVINRCVIVAKAPPVTPERVAPPAPKPTAPPPPPKVIARTPKPPVVKAVVTKSPAPEPTSANADQLIKEAQQAWFRGQYANAIDSARRALKVKPGLVSAHQIIAVCSCALGDSDSAAKAYQKLDDRNKQYVRTSCQKNGINF